MIVKYFLIFLFFINNYLLLPAEIGKNEILIKYSLSENNFSLLAINPPDKKDSIHNENTITAFCNNINNNLNIEIFSRIGFLKILGITSKTNSYIEINYNNKNNTLILQSLLGEFDILSLNSHITAMTKINGIEITNYASSYKIISYPDSNIFIKVIDGKINIKRNNDSILLITGESCEITEKYIRLSEIIDMETSLIILNNRLFSRYNKILSNNNIVISSYIKTKSKNNLENINEVKYFALENLFSETIMSNINFGNILETNIHKNPAFWNNLLRSYPVKQH